MKTRKIKIYYSRAIEGPDRSWIKLAVEEEVEIEDSNADQARDSLASSVVSFVDNILGITGE